MMWFLTKKLRTRSKGSVRRLVEVVTSMVKTISAVLLLLPIQLAVLSVVLRTTVDC